MTTTKGREAGKELSVARQIRGLKTKFNSSDQYYNKKKMEEKKKVQVHRNVPFEQGLKHETQMDI